MFDGNQSTMDGCHDFAGYLISGAIALGVAMAPKSWDLRELFFAMLKTWVILLITDIFLVLFLCDSLSLFTLLERSFVAGLILIPFITMTNVLFSDDEPPAKQDDRVL